MKMKMTTLALVAGLLAAAAAGAESPAPEVPRSGIDRAAMDPAVRPQDDLYTHVNGHWLQTTPIPPDKASVGVLSDVYDRTQEQLRSVVEDAQAHPSGPEAGRVAKLYASFMDEGTVGKLGLKPLAGELATIDAVADTKQFAALMPRLARRGVDMPIALSIGQDDREATRYVPSLSQSGLGLPNRDYYLAADDPKFKAVREKYVAYLARLLDLSGEGATAEPTARAVLALETEIARAQWSAVENRDPVKAYNRYELDALPKLAPGLDWRAWLDAARLAGNTRDVLVRQPSYLTSLGRLLETTPLETWKSYARLRLLDAYAPYLPKDFVDARFDFVGGVLNGITENRPRWKRGVVLVDEAIGHDLGQLYVRRYFPPAYKARMETLVANLIGAYRDSVGSLDWMGAGTRQAALAKLEHLNAKIGYPRRWIDYGRLEIRADDLVGNVMRAGEFEDARQLAKLGKPIDRDEWVMTPQTVNAYYDPSMNEVVFPAAFLQAPTFDPAADDAVNYGGIGAVIGHEISHGFDDKGSQYDASGNLRDWWTAEDRARFSAKTQVLVGQYSAFLAVPPDYHVNGELTLGENIADNSGLAIAWKAYQRSLGGTPAPVIDGLSGGERFYFGFAQVWRGKTRPDALLAQIKSDPHSPDEFRVLGAVRNQPGFYETFGVKPGDKMYLPPKDRVTIW